MTTKEKIKQKIDMLPDDVLTLVQKYIDNINPKKQPKKTIKTLHLKGQYDNVNVREIAYE